MAKNRDLLANKKGISSRNAFPPMKDDRWGRFIINLFPFICLFHPALGTDPVIGIGLPRGEPVRDTAMISAYYLSFCE